MQKDDINIDDIIERKTYKLLIAYVQIVNWWFDTFIIEIVPLVNPFVKIMISTLMISLKGKTYKPQFTLSIEGLYQIF